MNLAFIPVRCGSKSIPLKNIKIFCGQPLIYWNLHALQTSSSIDKIFVATDCESIKSVVENFNFSKVEVYERDAKNADDLASTESVIVEFLNKKKFNDNDLFFLVQATSPFTQSKDFDNALKTLKVNNADSLLTCVRAKRFLWNDKGHPLNYDFNNRPRRQDFNGTYMENGAFYINTIANIKKNQNRLSGNVVIHEMETFTSVEIDDDDDWKIAEMLMKKYIISKKANHSVKLFLSDVDGTLTDAGMYYGNNGEEFKKFNTHDGKGFELLRKAGIKTGIITSEKTEIVANRAKKLQLDYVYQGLQHLEKHEIVKEICIKENIFINEVAYVGDDINCLELLQSVGKAACPNNSQAIIKNIPGIILLNKNGGDGAVREFANIILDL